MRRTWRGGDTPAGEGSRHGGRAGCRYHQSWRVMRRSPKREASGRRQGDLIEATDDDGRGFRPDTLFHCPEGLGGRGGLDQQQPPRIEAKMRETGTIKSTTLTGQPERPAPHHETGGHRARRATVTAYAKAASRQLKREDQGGRGILVGLGLDLAETGSIELPTRQPPVHLRSAKGPSSSLRSPCRGHGDRRAAQALAALQCRQQSPEPLKACRRGMGGWRRCEKGGNHTAARETHTHTLTRTLTGTLTGTFVRIATNCEDPLGQGLGGEGVSGLLVQGYALRNCVWSALTRVRPSPIRAAQVLFLF